MDEGAAVVELVAPGYDDGVSSADCISIKWSNQGMHSWEGWPILAWDRTLQGNHIWIADTRSASSCSTDQGVSLWARCPFSTSVKHQVAKLTHVRLRDGRCW